ncbi:hypothetical protein KPL71_005949 [Citrus sinensis]|uniref:Uncharacterized protein n=1 Tax=Citrus sinensis TaxID=2711 RepID=A0ACB8NI45_CITSI|nr:hypothetical protein KPL71_005949 [Citrus sinensis]
MLKLPLSLRTTMCLLFLFISFNSGGMLKMASAQRTWCIANPLTNISALLGNLDFACSHVDCQLIQQGGSCFYPNTPIHHASFAMNLYFQVMGRHSSHCDFRGSGLISLTDPSYESCSFHSEGDLAEAPPSATWCVAKPGSGEYILQQNINYACNYVDCSPTHDGGSCFNPTTLINHASFAMNLYYQTSAKNTASCDFRNSGLVVVNDPSSGDCTYASIRYVRYL